MSNLKIYIAGSFTGERERKSLEEMIKIVRKTHPNDIIFVPMEHKIEGDFQKPDGSWNLSNPEWARRVFEMDRDNIADSDLVIAMYTGHYGTTGTAWELGFAYSQGIKTVLYIPDWVKEQNVSLMILNSTHWYMNKEGKINKITNKWLSQFNQK